MHDPAPHETGEPESPESFPWSNGLVLFPPRTLPRLRRAKWIFAAIVLVTAAGITWPVYPRFSGIRPMILGLPLSFAWIIAWLVVVFAAFVWLYRVEYGGGSDETPEGRR